MTTCVFTISYQYLHQYYSRREHWIISGSSVEHGTSPGVISENGLSIRSYSGSFDRDSHTFYMSYEVSGLSVQINKVGNALRDVAGVRSYNSGWHLE